MTFSFHPSTIDSSERGKAFVPKDYFSRMAKSIVATSSPVECQTCERKSSDCRKTVTSIAVSNGKDANEHIELDASVRLSRSRHN